MKVLIIKTSSMGDVIHTLPALTDAQQAIPDIEFDWVVERAFQEIPSWHTRVKQIIPVSLRRWRKQPLRTLFTEEWKTFRQQIKKHDYDLVIDAQGLVKSAFVTRMAKGVRCGLDAGSAREALAALAYQKKFTVEFKQHAVVRARELFAKVLGYPLPKTTADYGIDKDRLAKHEFGDGYIVFLHGTTWATKHWPEQYWHQLAKQVTEAGYHILLPWGNAEELQRAQAIATISTQIDVLPKLNLIQVAGILADAKMAVAVDTGLGHLAAALALPTISLYGPTDPILTGTMGAQQVHLAADFACAPCLARTCTFRGKHEIEPPCFATVNPERVWQQMQAQLQTLSLSNNEISTHTL